MDSLYSSLGDVALQESEYSGAGTCDWELEPSKTEVSSHYSSDNQLHQPPKHRLCSRVVL